MGPKPVRASVLRWVNGMGWRLSDGRGPRVVSLHVVGEAVEEQVELDGRHIHLRPIRPEDEPAHLKF